MVKVKSLIILFYFRDLTKRFKNCLFCLQEKNVIPSKIRTLNKKPTQFEWVLWYLQGSNQGHMDFQSIALPSELRYLAIAGANIG